MSYNFTLRSIFGESFIYFDVNYVSKIETTGIYFYMIDEVLKVVSNVCKSVNCAYQYYQNGNLAKLEKNALITNPDA